MTIKRKSGECYGVLHGRTNLSLRYFMKNIKDTINAVLVKVTMMFHRKGRLLSNPWVKKKISLDPLLPWKKCYTKEELEALIKTPSLGKGIVCNLHMGKEEDKKRLQVQARDETSNIREHREVKKGQGS